MFRPIMVALSASFGLALLSYPNTVAGAEKLASLRDNPVIKEMKWVADFGYERRTSWAQRQEVITYTAKMKEDHVKSLRARQLPWVRPTLSADEDFVIGYSHGWPGEPKIEPLPLFGYQITDPDVNKNKLEVILVGSNHPREDPACWALHGLIEFLVSDAPEAKTIRENVIFYVYPLVNPDGKQYVLSRRHASLMTSNGSPEIKAAGETNHNRQWNTDGQFVSIDTIKAAMRKDTGGFADYLLDFHGIPGVTFSFACEVSIQSPLGEALLRRGMNFRQSEVEPGAPRRTLRSWSMSDDGVAKIAFTPEIANHNKEELFLQGRLFALALHDMITGTERPIPHLAKIELTPLQPQKPVSAWLLDGNVESAVNANISGTANAVKWSGDTPFDYQANQSLVLDSGRSSIDFGSAAELDFRQSMTVSLWAKGNAVSDGASYIISRYRTSSDQRSWAFVQAGNLTEMMVIISSDGTHDRDKIKRYLSALWPAKSIFDGTWRHLAFTFDKNVLKLYVDGLELQTGAGLHYFNDGDVPELSQSEANLRVGALGGGSNAFQGLIDEVGIWDYALSPEEIRWLAGNSLKGLGDLN